MVAPNPEFISELSAAGGDGAKMCFQCGTCTAGCPSGKITAYRIRKLMRMAQLGLKEDIISSEDLWQCTTCYTCEERCPRGVPIVDVVIALRNIAVANGKMFPAHKKTGQNLVAYDTQSRSTIRSRHRGKNSDLMRFPRQFSQTRRQWQTSA